MEEIFGIKDDSLERSSPVTGLGCTEDQEGPHLPPCQGRPGGLLLPRAADDYALGGAPASPHTLEMSVPLTSDRLHIIIGYEAGWNLADCLGQSSQAQTLTSTICKCDVGPKDRLWGLMAHPKLGRDTARW